MKFRKDVIIDIVCYRRRGHNEGDEPAITQPLMYEKIRAHPTVLSQYSQALIQAGAIELAEYERRILAYRDALDEGSAVAWDYLQEPDTSLYVDWSSHLSASRMDLVDTSFEASRFEELGSALLDLPAAFKPHRQVKRILDERERMNRGEQALNWGFAENMAYATLLDQGFHIRLTGQDVGRGTFAHRHAVLHDQSTGQALTPLQGLGVTGEFNLFDSLLSEEAVLAFEYGYSQTSPRTLVVWEAQFGDFANGAQVVIDQFITSGEQKWGRLSGLTMLLPHGYEGAGPEHSSARLERYLQLCAEHNIQVCVPSTPAQIYHLLRRQMLSPVRKPLVIMSPKSLLRHPEAVSDRTELTDGGFEAVLPDKDASKSPDLIERLVLCSGKVYYDLLEARALADLKTVGILRIEQLYPFPEQGLSEKLTPYSNIKEVVWCQEEPMNQGAWYSSQHHMRRVLLAHYPDSHLAYAGRKASAAAAAGHMGLHTEQQKALIEQALTGVGDSTHDGV